MASRKKTDEGQPRQLTAADREHIASLQERFGAALSGVQIEANYRMSLGLPDATGRLPSSREQLGALKLFSDLAIPRPKAEERQEQTAVVVGCPFCGPCACGRSSE